MAKEIINVGQAANDGTGDPLRNAFEKVNSNFTELYDTADTQDLDFTGDSGTGAVELDSQTLNLVGTNGVQTTANGQTITIDTSSLDTRLTTAEADIDTNTASITTEETARIASDTTLQANIDSEASTRATADTTLQTNIDAEATTRGSADTTLQTNIDSEAATRLANDNTLQSNIDAEAATRLANDNTLQGNIDTEASTRSSADTALQGQIDSNDTDIATNAANIATNTTNISSNDTDISGLDSRLTTAEGNITSNDTDITGLNNRLTTAEGNISSNDTDIATNASNIATNVTNIATNVTNIATNATDIATNVTNIASNDTDISNLQSGKQNISEKNQANGYAPLDSGAKIPIANLPDSVVGQVEYQGTWDASIDDPTLPSASTVKGHYYVVSVGGTYETITYAIGDWIISNGVAWEKIDNTDAVTTVFGRLGAIVANEGDYSSYYPLIADLTAAEADITTNATNISTNTSNISTNTSDIATNATNISSNDTDITALQTDKYDKTGGTISGNATITGDFNFGDNNKAIFGTDSDLKIYHSGSSSIIEDVGQGDLVIKGTDLYLRNAANSNRLYAGTDVRLYYNGAEKIRTTSTGVSVTGNLIVDTNTLYVDSTYNRVGIGTDSPSSILEISKNDQTNGAVLSITNSFDGASWAEGDTIGSIDFKITDGSTAQKVRGQIKVFDDATSSGTFPAYNAMSFSTANLGVLSERMRITSAGNVGIGTDSPNEKLHVNGGTTNVVANFESTDDKAYISFKDSSTTNTDTVFLGAEGNDMTFYAGSAASPRMLIDSSGDVGIGSESPSAKLHVFKSSHPNTMLARFENPSGEALVEIKAQNDALSVLQFADSEDGNVGAIQYSHPENSMRFKTADAERMRITSGGRVGINETNPLAELHVTGSIRSAINSTAGGNTLIGGINGVSSGHAIITDTSNNITYSWNTGTNARALTINPSGSVGIGTTSPDSLLDVSSNSTPTIRITNTSQLSTSYTVGAFEFYTEDASTPGGARVLSSILCDNNIGSSVPNGELVFSTALGGGSGAAATEKMRIDSNGNVGIGSDSPSAKLEITAPNSNTFLSNITSTTSANIHQIKNDNSKGIETVIYSSAYSGGTYLNVGANGSVINSNSKTAITTVGAFDLLLGTNSVERMRIDSSGNVGIGTGSSPSAKLHVKTTNTTAEDVAHFGNNNITDGLAVTTNGNLDWGFNARNTRNLTFSTAQTERMRITSGGDVIINSTSSAGENKDKLVYSPVASWVVQNHSTARTSGSHYTLFYYGTTSIGSITQSGTTGVSYNTSSDYRLKENVVEMTGALDRVDALKPSRFNFIADAEKTVDGFLAHEVAEVVPEAISGEKDAVEDYEVTPAVLDDEGNVIEEAVMGTRPVYQGIDQSKLVPLLVGAIQELKAEIETLKSQINN